MIYINCFDMYLYFLRRRGAMIPSLVTAIDPRLPQIYVNAGFEAFPT
ncbi:hypothetical protein VP489E541_P0058 [Vibrio phage 489E54-1]|nr:hypothetical protein VP489E541_P0058 [Vibrio phage 489E54-1]